MKIERYNTLFQEKIWSARVKTKRTAPEGLFASGSAQEIANWTTRGEDLQSAISAINFYINRAGKNLSPERIGTLEHAKELVRKKFKK